MLPSNYLYNLKTIITIITVYTLKRNSSNKESNRFPLRRKSKIRINLTFFLLSLVCLAGLVWLLIFLRNQPHPILNRPLPASTSPVPSSKDTFPSKVKSSVTDTTHNLNFGLPAITKNDRIVKHFAFTLSYSEEHEQAKWVAYRLRSYETTGQEARSDNFREDPAVITGSAVPLDYLRSGYDRGHLVPAADMKWSSKAMSETFLMSNISPQVHDFNSGIWSKLEKKVRTWAVNNEEIHVVTGPVLQPGLPKIGKNKVSVPSYFYKVILDAKEPEVKAIGFIIPNRQIKTSFWNFAVSVDSVETLTGIDFFSALPDQLEQKLEAEPYLNSWK